MLLGDSSRKMDKPQIILHAHKALNYTLFDTKWIPSSAKFVTIGNQPKGSGTIQIYEVSHGDVELLKQVSKRASVSGVTFLTFALVWSHHIIDCSIQSTFYFFNFN